MERKVVSRFNEAQPADGGIVLPGECCAWGKPHAARRDGRVRLWEHPTAAQFNRALIRLLEWKAQRDRVLRDLARGRGLKSLSRRIAAGSYPV
jgi:hypothetical protein